MEKYNIMLNQFKYLLKYFQMLFWNVSLDAIQLNKR
jgi:hypothetical protein